MQIDHRDCMEKRRMAKNRRLCASSISNLIFSNNKNKIALCAVIVGAVTSRATRWSGSIAFMEWNNKWYAHFMHIAIFLFAFLWLVDSVRFYWWFPSTCWLYILLAIEIADIRSNVCFGLPSTQRYWAFFVCFIRYFVHARSAGQCFVITKFA